jgi:hypothetical protein
VLHAVAELRRDRVGNVERVLRNEIDADALGTDEAGDLLDAIHQRLGRVVEQQMRFIEKEHELGLGLVADLGQRLPQLSEHPEQEGRVETRLLHQLVGGQDIHDAAAIGRGADEVPDVERRLAKEVISALLVEHQEAPLDGADRRNGNVAVLGRQFLGARGDVVDDGAQVAEINER